MIKFEEGVNKWRINRIKFFDKDKEWFEDNNKLITIFEDPEGSIVTLDTVNIKGVRYHKLILLIFSLKGAKIVDELFDNLGYLRGNKYTNMYKNSKNNNLTIKVEIPIKAKDYILYCE
jgi:hypothetical protein